MTAARALSAGARIGVDIGGTFTDVVLVQDDRVRAVAKTLTTPSDPSLGVAEGVARVLRETRPGDVVEVVHGTTLVSNALIERKGARTCLLTTRGFRDALAIRREHRYDLYDLFMELPEPLVPRRLRWEVSERVLADGTVDQAIDTEEVRRLARRARAVGVQAIAITFLHAYRFPKHEHVAERALREELPDVPISLSSEVAPELGEYVRASTTAANAYVQPVMDRYLRTISKRLGSLGVTASIHLMLSTGGFASLETGRRFPVRLSESGPAGGAIGAAMAGLAAGETDMLAFDMGGTTAKACLVEDGRPLLTNEHEVARVYRFKKESGLPLRVPVVDLIEIGAGGGSIAHVDTFGLPKVGPQSAGAEPGPACYGRGGRQPTVTDADLLLGYLDPNFFLGGELTLSVARAERALSGPAGRLGLDLSEAAAAVHEVVNESMAAAARVHAIERGRDIRRFVLVATGGAGPVHAWGVARKLGIERILYPAGAGVASALGMLAAPPAFDLARSLPAVLEQVCWDEVREAIGEMTRQGTAELLSAGILESLARVELTAEIRYQGQGEPVTVALGAGLGRDPLLQVGEAFRSSYAKLYGRHPSGVRPEVLTWRVRVAGPAPSLDFVPAQGSHGPALKGERRVWSADEAAFVGATVWDRYALRPGDIVQGPAVCEERESSVVIGAGGRGQVDGAGNLRVEIHG
jgi:N-methylhydantoinase A